LSVRAGTQHALLLHRLGEVLRAAAQSFERAALGIDRAVRVAFSQLTFRLAHGVAGAAELIHLALPLLALAEALLAQLLQQFLELIAQCLLILAQLTHLIALLALLPLLAPADRAAHVGDRAAGLGPAGTCDRASSSPSFICCPGRAICKFSSICCRSCSIRRAASLAPERAIC